MKIKNKNQNFDLEKIIINSEKASRELLEDYQRNLAIKSKNVNNKRNYRKEEKYISGITFY